MFFPYITGPKASATGYTVAGHGDLNNIFSPYTSGSQAAATGYTVNGADLNTIFAPSFPIFTTTGGSKVTYTNSTYVITFTTNGTMKFNSSISTTVNYLFVGGGGGGGSSDNSYGVAGGGGGGSGGQVLYLTNVFGSNPTISLSFTVAVAPQLVTGKGANGNPTICSGTDITTIISNGGAAGNNGSSNGYGGTGGVGTSCGGSGGNGGDVLTTQGENGFPGSSYVINGIEYWFGGGGAGGNNATGSPYGGHGGGGGSGGGNNGNNGVNPYIGPNGISQTSTASGYNNSGGGGAGCNSQTNFNRAGSSGIVVVWFSYP